MLESQKKTLFFVVSPKQDLKSVSAFLSKRNFNVQSETDVRDALLRIIELQPDFVFLAWDHSDKKITTLPALIAQASAASVVPFISTNTNEAIIKFSNCAINPKLFPPMTGPAVERLILKSSRHDIDQQAKQEKIRAQLKNKEDLKLLQQQMIASLDSETSREMESNFQVKAGEIENADTPAAVEVAHTPPPPPPEAVKAKTGLIIQKGFRHSMDLGSIIQKSEYAETALASIKREPLRAYCISIFNESWCGYFIVSTRVKLDFARIDSVFSGWIKMQLGEDQQILEKDFFEFDSIDQSRLSVLESSAEYSEKIEVDDEQINISFFKVSPDYMLVERNVDNGYIKVRTDDIPVGQKLEFSLLIHLPENKKYLLYTAANSALEPEQKARLLKNKIETLYTTPEYENSFRKFLAHKALSGKLGRFGKDEE